MSTNSEAAAEAVDHNPASGVPVEAIAATYEQRSMDRLSDEQLAASVTEVISTPRQDSDSFILHAPLELIARRRLLPLVQPSARRLARMHLLAIAANFEAFGDAVDFDAGAGAGSGPGAVQAGVDGLLQELLASIDSGDQSTTDRVTRELERPTIAASINIRSLLDTVAPAIADRTAAAAHAPIFLQNLRSSAGDAPALLPLFRPLARELTRQPEHRLSWLDDHAIGQTGRHAAGGMVAGGTTADVPVDQGGADALFTVLANAPRLGVPGSTFIHPTMMQVDKPDVAGSLLPSALGGLPQESARAVMRVAALSMLHDTPEHGPYGWTHCLTLPQAILAITPHLRSSQYALAIAATQVLGFRAALGEVDLPAPALGDAGPAAEVLARAGRLATRAAASHDAHIAKYAMAVIDAARFDPEATDLYLSAGERLLWIWDELGGDPTDPLQAEALAFDQASID